MILVVASAPATREWLMQLIGERGYPVGGEDCGEAVVDRLRFAMVSMIVLDCDVAKSFETLEKVRGDPRHGRVPVVMYSESGVNVKERALGKGADSFVAKR